MYKKKKKRYETCYVADLKKSYKHVLTTETLKTLGKRYHGALFL
jgi:hypothetical protein